MGWVQYVGCLTKLSSNRATGEPICTGGQHNETAERMQVILSEELFCYIAESTRFAYLGSCKRNIGINSCQSSALESFLLVIWFHKGNRISDFAKCIDISSNSTKRNIVLLTNRSHVDIQAG